MPRSILHIGGLRYINDDVDTYTHVVVGCRNESAEKPATFGITAAEMQKKTPEERDKIHEANSQFALAQVSGRFALKPLRWYTSPEAAAAGMNEFMALTIGTGAPVARYVNLAVLPVSRTLEHA